jgi:hypothetical protein
MSGADYGFHYDEGGMAWDSCEVSQSTPQPATPTNRPPFPTKNGNFSHPVSLSILLIIEISFQVNFLDFILSSMEYSILFCKISLQSTVSLNTAYTNYIQNITGYNFLTNM